MTALPEVTLAATPEQMRLTAVPVPRAGLEGVHS